MQHINTFYRTFMFLFNWKGMRIHLVSPQLCNLIIYLARYYQIVHYFYITFSCNFVFRIAILSFSHFSEMLCILLGVYSNEHQDWSKHLNFFFYFSKYRKKCMKPRFTPSVPNVSSDGRFCHHLTASITKQIVYKFLCADLHPVLMVH